MPDADADEGDPTHEIPTIYASYDALVYLGLIRPRGAA
jgi:hypothetical protein